MQKYIVEIQDELNCFLQEAARLKNISVEHFITEILNSYAVDPHMMEQDDVKDGYEESGSVNLDWSNL